MRKTGLFLTIILVGLLLFSNCAGLRVNTELKRLGIDFGNKNNILQLEDPAFFKLWTHWRPIELLMTVEEKKLAKEISEMIDEAARNLYIEAFIKWFWTRRDDNPYDEFNEFKENFYDRVVEAQTRFAQKENVRYFRRCKYGKGWKTDMGLMYILLGESSYPTERQDVRSLLSLFDGSYQDSALLPQEIEVWFYDAPDDFYSWISESGAVWLLFERDSSGYWQWGERTIGLFYSYQNYRGSLLNPGASLTYSVYISEVYKFIQAVAESYIYDKDLEFEDFLKNQKGTH